LSFTATEALDHRHTARVRVAGDFSRMAPGMFSDIAQFTTPRGRQVVFIVAVRSANSAPFTRIMIEEFSQRLGCSIEEAVSEIEKLDRQQIIERRFLDGGAYYALRQRGDWRAE
jgi:hypothetical protein